MDEKAFLLERFNDPELQGWCSVDKGVDMFDRVCALKPHLVVEIGVFGGKSLTALGLAAKKIGQCEVIGIDPYKAEDAAFESEGQNLDWWTTKVDLNQVYDWAKTAIAVAGIGGCTHLYRSTSADAFKNIRPGIGILHIDGNHSTWSSCLDVLLWFPKVIPGGLIYFDDANWETTSAARHILESRCDVVRDIGGESECRVYEKRSNTGVGLPDLQLQKS